MKARNYSELFRLLHAARDMKATVLAKRGGPCSSTIYRWRRSKQPNPMFHTLNALALVLGGEYRLILPGKETSDARTRKLSSTGTVRSPAPRFLEAGPSRFRANTGR